MTSEEKRQRQRQRQERLLVRGVPLPEIVARYKAGERIEDIANTIGITRQRLGWLLLERYGREWRKAVTLTARRRLVNAIDSRERRKASRWLTKTRAAPPKPQVRTKAQKQARLILRALRPDIWKQRSERVQGTRTITKGKRKGQKASHRVLLVPCPKCSGQLVIDQDVRCYGQRCTDHWTLAQMCGAADGLMPKDSAAELI